MEVTIREADLSYYGRSEREEEALAAAAHGPEAASVHRLLGLEYASEARKLALRFLSDGDIDLAEALGHFHMAV